MTPRSNWLLPLALLVPLLLAVIWGINFDDSVYGNLIMAGNVATGVGMPDSWPADALWPAHLSPLFSAVLLLPALLNVDLTGAALVISGLGWLASGGAIYAISRRIRRPVAGAISVILLAFSPVIVSSIGSQLSWTIAFALWSIFFLYFRKDPLLGLALVSLVAIQPVWYGIVFTLLILIYQIWVDRRLHWITTLAVIFSGIIWMIANQWTLYLPDLSPKPQFFQRLLDQSELHWLLVPFLILGTWLIFRDKVARPILIAVIWAILAAIGGQPEVLLIVTLLLVGFVVDWAIEKIIQIQLVSLSRRQLSFAAILIVVAVLGWAQLSSLRREFDQRQITHRHLEAQIASWLADEAPASASILSSERTGYLARRSTANWPVLNQGMRAGAVLEMLQETIVDYVVTYNDLSGNNLIEMVWFRLSYEPVKQISSEYDTLAPATIWGFRPPLNNDGQRQTINARVPDRMHIIGYQIWPEQLRPGDPVEVALYLQAPQSTFVNQGPFTAIVRLASPDGITHHEWTVSLPEQIKPDAWQPNKVIVEQLSLTLPENVPAGEYSFHISFSSPDSTELWPISSNNDVNPVDRIRVGQIMVEGS